MRFKMTVKSRRWTLAIAMLVLAMVNEMYQTQIIAAIGSTLERLLVIGLGLVCFSALIPEILGFED